MTLTGWSVFEKMISIEIRNLVYTPLLQRQIAFCSLLITKRSAPRLPRECLSLGARSPKAAHIAHQESRVRRRKRAALVDAGLALTHFSGILLLKKINSRAVLKPSLFTRRVI